MWGDVDGLWREFINIPGEGAGWVSAEFSVITEPLWQAEESHTPHKKVLPTGIVYPKLLRQLFKYFLNNP